MEIVLPIYIGVMVVAIAFSLFVFMWEGAEETRIGSRIILLAPIWPLLIPVFAGRAVKWLWTKADWKGAEQEEELLRQQRRGGTRGW